MHWGSDLWPMDHSLQSIDGEQQSFPLHHRGKRKSNLSELIYQLLLPVTNRSRKSNRSTEGCSKFKNIVAAFRGMHVSPGKHSYAWLPRKCDYRTDRQTDGWTPDKVIPMCIYALQLQATQKPLSTFSIVINHPIWWKCEANYLPPWEERKGRFFQELDIYDYSVHCTYTCAWKLC